MRNMATVGGNLLQRTRCSTSRTSRSRATSACPGAAARRRAASTGNLAILGHSRRCCVATHPSDMAVALAALDARVHVTGPDGGRSISMPAAPAARRQAGPGHRARPGELITAVELPPPPLGVDVPQGARARIVRVRAGVASPRCSTSTGTGACATAGWPSAGWRTSRGARTRRTGASRRPAAADDLRQGGRRGARRARPLPGNAYKVTLARNLIVGTSGLAAGDCRRELMTRVEGIDKVTGQARYAFEYPCRRRGYGARSWRRSPAGGRGRRRQRRARPCRACSRCSPRDAPRAAAAEDAELRCSPAPQISLPRPARRRVVAETLETARAAAAAVAVAYDRSRTTSCCAPTTRACTGRSNVNPGYPRDTGYGDVDAALAAAAVRVDETYTTPAAQQPDGAARRARGLGRRHG